MNCDHMQLLFGVAAAFRPLLLRRALTPYVFLRANFNPDQSSFTEQTL